MAWTYSDWRSQSTAAQQLARLNLHMQEVSDKIGAEVGASGYQRSSHALTNYLELLETQRVGLSSAAATGGGVAFGRFTGC